MELNEQTTQTFHRHGQCGRSAFVSFLAGAYLFILLALPLAAGCGGGRSTARSAQQTTTDTTTATGTTTTTDTTTTDTTTENPAGVSVAWFSEEHGDHYLLDINYSGEPIVRQLQVRGIASGETVTAEPYDGIESTATDSTYVATSIYPYKGYKLESVPLTEYEDDQGVYYRAWIFFPAWAESKALPDRLDLYAKITYSGGTYKATEPEERLAVGYEHCYGPSYWDQECQPATATVLVEPATGTASTPFTITCEPGIGTVYNIEIVCDYSSKTTEKEWTTIFEGNSMPCLYNASGSFNPACRLDYARVYQIESPLSVSSD